LPHAVIGCSRAPQTRDPRLSQRPPDRRSNGGSETTNLPRRHECRRLSPGSRRVNRSENSRCACNHTRAEDWEPHHLPPERDTRRTPDHIHRCLFTSGATRRFGRPSGVDRGAEGRRTADYPVPAGRRRRRTAR
jgi:hypothetical protein